MLRFLGLYARRRPVLFWQDKEAGGPYLTSCALRCPSSTCLLRWPAIFRVPGRPVHLARRPRWSFCPGVPPWTFTTDGIALPGTPLLSRSPPHHGEVQVGLWGI